MTIRHHPSEATLVSYAAGAVDEAEALLIATHLALCPACRRDVGDAEAMGGALLDCLEPEPVSADWQAVLRRSHGQQVGSGPAIANDHAAGDAGSLFPRPLRDYLGGATAASGLPWRTVVPGLRRIRVARGRFRASLLRISGGVHIPHHGHGGTELTMVLAGGYSDGDLQFLRGDVQELDSLTRHEPVADADGDCIALAVTDSPLRFESRLAGLVQRLRGY